jgi:epoxyqueuosine reductase
VPVTDQPALLSPLIKAEALRLGFHLVGITTPDPPAHLPVFESWLSQGRQGEMAYLGTERGRQARSDPRLLLPECRSILVVGLRYPAPGPVTASMAGSPPTGRVASYAWGADYHAVIPRRLQSLAAFIEEQVGCPVPSRWYTDTGPLLERELAQRSGLGWIGKNTCLINPNLGSYFLLAEVLLGLDLEPDLPFIPDRCGTCTRCLEACPTSCILPDRTIDARRCISYLTIEVKSEIPAELRPKIGEWVFGCDVCQQVCPWNQHFATSLGDPELEARPGLPRPDLTQELGLDRAAFSAKFKGSPVKRAKRGGYLRNVAVALGNQGAVLAGNPAAVDALAKALQGDPDPLVRGHAAWALRVLGGEMASQALSRAMQTETDPHVLSEIQPGMR